VPRDTVTPNVIPVKSPVALYLNHLEWVQSAWRAKFGDKPLNKAELCRDSGITPPAFYRLEEGNSKPETIAALARYFGVPEPKRAVVAEGVEEPAPTALSLLRDAMGNLAELRAMLEGSTPDVAAMHRVAADMVKARSLPGKSKRKEPHPKSG
jgi:transcriptional regulator with XRE-family HTH domain